MRRACLAILLMLTNVLSAPAANSGDDVLYGFTSASSSAEREWENKFRAIPGPKIQRDSMQRLTARPHHVGSPYDKQNAEWILSQFKTGGLAAQIETCDLLVPRHKDARV